MEYIPQLLQKLSVGPQKSWWANNTILKFSTNKEYNSSTSLNIFKSILKPTRSFKTFKKENRRISFGSIEIMAV